MALQWKFPSPIQPIYLVADDSALVSVSWQKQNAPMAKNLASPAPEIKILKQAVRELEEYFAGKRTHFTLPLQMDGTKFQKQVWAQLAKIPYGMTCAYKDVASGIKKAKAVRAVGSANGKNPFCIVIPCHRVIAADGSLGGYTGGLNIKRKLLALEQEGI